ncbi:DUF192 domain-containing protein [Yoonia sp. 208BN28-4]|uniref:DUF192 domain-containing protein n=1 Tax=Yoonia sp. 208BN28-4 TaxID=3126505 RepID=UPI0030AA6107
MGRSIEMMKTGLAVILALMAQPAAAACSDGRVTVAGDFGQAHFSVDVADDAQERAQGLMFVESMPILSGMLFVYEAPQVASFWMQNTLIPLDMLFAQADGTITHIHPEAIPGDRTSILGGDDIQYVLEINGGLAARLGIKPGAVLQHPAIGPDAALPCDG